MEHRERYHMLRWCPTCENDLNLAIPNYIKRMSEHLNFHTKGMNC